MRSIATVKLTSTMAAAANSVLRYLKHGAERGGWPYAETSGFIPGGPYPPGLVVIPDREIDWIRIQVYWCTPETATLIAYIWSTYGEHGGALVEIKSDLNPRTDSATLVQLVQDMPVRCFRRQTLPDAPTPRDEPHPTDQLFANYYRQRAQGRKVSLQTIAKQSGYTYAYVRKLKMDYDRRKGRKPNSKEP